MRTKSPWPAAASGNSTVIGSPGAAYSPVLRHWLTSVVSICSEACGSASAPVSSNPGKMAAVSSSAGTCSAGLEMASTSWTINISQPIPCVGIPTPAFLKPVGVPGTKFGACSNAMVLMPVRFRLASKRSISVRRRSYSVPHSTQSPSVRQRHPMVARVDMRRSHMRRSCNALAEPARLERGAGRH